jgi:hypothetical protein
VSGAEGNSALFLLAAQIDFHTEDYYNLYDRPADSRPAERLSDEVWTSLSSLTADLAKIRGEMYRLGHGVERLRMPAIEAVGLDKVAEQLRGLELRLRPLGELLAAQQDGDRIRRLLKDLLAVLDALDRVFELVENQPGAVSEGVMRGLHSVRQLMLDILARQGLKPMEPGSQFDPHRQMAMGTEPVPGRQDGEISRVLLTGYLVNDEVFRTAQVVVVKNQK